MKQTIRLLARPAAFFNQLQWSTHHWFIVVSFLSLAAIEAHVGRQQAMYHTFATILQSHLHLGVDASLWVVTALRLAFLVTGAFVVSSLIWSCFFSNVSSRQDWRKERV